MSNVSPTILSGMDIKETSRRQVPRQDFSQVFKESLATTTRILANGVAIATPGLDVSKGVISTMSQSLIEKGAQINNKNFINTEGGDTKEGPVSDGNNQAISSSTDLLSATKALQEANWQFSLEYLNLQEKVQNENRYFTTVSNVMRTRHDSAKNAINNLR